MARVFIEGFESGSTDLWEKEAAGCGISTVVPPGSGMYSAFCSNDYSQTKMWRSVPPQADYYVAFKVNANITWARRAFFHFKGTNGSILTSFSFFNSEMSLHIGDSGTIIQTIGGFAINTWHNIEIYCLPKTDTTGRIIFKVNGILLLDFTGITSAANDQISKIGIGYYCDRNDSSYIDDIVLDNSELPGYTRIQQLLVRGPGMYKQFVPSIACNPIPTPTTRWRMNITAASSTIKLRSLFMYVKSDNIALSSLGAVATSDLGSALSTIDNNLDTEWAAGGVPHWVQIDFLTPVIIDSYGYQIGVYGDNSPKNFTLDYWDGTSWITVDSRINLSFGASYQIYTYEVYNDSWTLVNEVPPNDSDYVRADVVDLLDTYSLSNFVPPQADVPWKIKCLQVQARADFEGITSVTGLNLAVLSGATLAESATQSLSTVFKSVAGLWELNPATGLLWTVDDINALEAGFKSKL